MFGRKKKIYTNSKTYDDAISNLKIFAKSTDELKPVVADLEKKEITDEQFIAICVEVMTKELIEWRENDEKIRLQTW